MLSRVIRRTHMYLALFLAPWVLAYALSTIVMNHSLVEPVHFELERTQAYQASFAPGASPREMAAHILADMDLEGAFGVRGPRPDGTLTIDRQGLLTPRRLIYAPAAGTLTIERAAFHASTLLNRFHHRRGYGQPFLADRTFAGTVDLVIAALVFWALSGVWMWWEMRATRRWGAVCGALGLGLFLALVMTI